MAQFKVGQRVRIIGCRVNHGHVGLETVITHIPARAPLPGSHSDCTIFVNGEHFSALFCHLAPLLPPDEAADAFLARLKKLGSEPVNAKVTERVGK